MCINAGCTNDDWALFDYNHDVRDLFSRTVSVAHVATQINGSSILVWLIFVDHAIHFDSYRFFVVNCLICHVITKESKFNTCNARSHSRTTYSLTFHYANKHVFIHIINKKKKKQFKTAWIKTMNSKWSNIKRKTKRTKKH